MIRFNFFKMVAVFALIILLGGSLPASAAPRTADGPAVTPTDLPLPIVWLRSLLTSAWTKEADEGCRIDPNGCRRSPDSISRILPDEPPRPQASSASGDAD